MRSIVLASGNRKKAHEFADLMRSHDIALRVAADFPAAPEVQESGATFAENAAIKATETARALGLWCLADDSGLMVDALDGAPGVHSARYAGANATDAENNQKLLRALAGVPQDRRTARFVCHLTVADPAGVVRLAVSGECQGLIVDDHRGAEGFGYDPYFLVPEYGQTFGELPLVVKSRISHRATAFATLIPQLMTLLQAE